MAALENSCQRHEFVGRGDGEGRGGIHPRKFLKSRGSEMVFSVFSKKTQPGYGVRVPAGKAGSKKLKWLHTMMMTTMKTSPKMNLCPFKLYQVGPA